MENFTSEFEKENPNIKIERDAQRADEMRPIIQASLTSGIGPDIIYYDTGPGFAGVLAKVGLLMPLDTAYLEQE